MRHHDTAMPLQGELDLDEVQAGHAARAREHIGACIEHAGGWISFERFMDLALYAPGLGYYSAGARKLGAGGDFTTAPEISRLFGACLARQCAEVLQSLGGGMLLEVGAGSGRLAADLLARLESLGSLPARYAILEVSADLRERQRDLLAARLPHLLGRIAWLDAPPAEPFDGVVIANEVLDALPAARFRWHATHVEELGVALRGSALVPQARPAGEELTRACRRLAAAGAERTGGERWTGSGGGADGDGWADGYESEYCARLEPFTHAVTRALRAGAVLWIDYGLPRRQYYLPERRTGTFLCHFRQRAHDDAFLCPGLQDMTAWVDYTWLAECGRSAGFSISGFATQGYLLAALAIDQEMAIMAAGREGELARLAAQARRLMMPGEMGERFKAMAWSRGLDAPLKGFSLQDLRHTL
jgi:SAM-dependent MidA family methyltransferase